MKTKNVAPPAWTLLLLGLCACVSAKKIPPAEPIVETAAKAVGEPVLYARDGSVVVGDQPGSITTTGEPTRDVASHAGSRMYLLDLYQKAMDEKDALSIEVKGLNAALAHEQAALEVIAKERDALTAQLRELQSENQRVGAENADLAARLTTAQIRRLEAEKLLLEAQIEWQRAQAADADAARKGRSPASAPRVPSAAGTPSLKRSPAGESAPSTTPVNTHGQEGKP